jgi:hypothetical protein
MQHPLSLLRQADDACSGPALSTYREFGVLSSTCMPSTIQQIVSIEEDAFHAQNSHEVFNSAALFA